MRDITRVAVLGSGVMGGAIAAHLANCGIPSLMLDIVPRELTDADKSDRSKRNAIAAQSKAALLKTKPSPVYSKSVLDLIAVGNFEDDIAGIADCDWIIEVVTERLEIKKRVFENVKKHRKPGSIVSTNTSGIPLKDMVSAMDDDMRKNFLGTHFFNPPRYLKLVEIIPAPDTDPDVIRFMAEFLEGTLGKGVVYAKDTPNFIANRILTFGSSYIMHEMQSDGLVIEEVDALTGPAVGHASSATFRTVDLVGLDTMINVIGNVADNCPDDERIELIRDMPGFVTKMAEKGMLGNKSGGGFFKATNKKNEKGKRIILGLDLETLEYRDPVSPKFECTGAARKSEDLHEKLRIMHTGEDKGSVFAWKVFANTAIYAGNRIPEIADDIVNIDNACRWGFAWEIGIFETWDALGFDYVCDRMAKDGLELPPIAKTMRESGADRFYKYENGQDLYFDVASKSYQPVPRNPNEIGLPNLKKNEKVVQHNESATIVDIGDGIICVEFHTKMNSIDQGITEAIGAGVDLLDAGKFEGMVIGNQEPHFCAGANVFLILGEAMQQNWDNIDRAVSDLQQTLMRVRFSKRPVVTAPHHFTLGGGCEISQAGARAVIAGETYGGLVEVGVGLVPGGGGCKELLRRALAYCPPSVADADPFPYVRRAFENIAQARVSTSGLEMVELGYLSEEDCIAASFDQQIKKAKDVCLGLIQSGYRSPKPATLIALGEPVRAAFKVALYGFDLGGFASAHDVLIAEKLANILTGGHRKPGTKMPEKTHSTSQHMLITGKPLRN